MRYALACRLRSHALFSARYACAQYKATGLPFWAALGHVYIESARYCNRICWKLKLIERLRNDP